MSDTRRVLSGQTLWWTSVYLGWSEKRGGNSTTSELKNASFITSAVFIVQTRRRRRLVSNLLCCSSLLSYGLADGLTRRLLTLTTNRLHSRHHVSE